MSESVLLASWSGGKDSCLALHEAVAAGGRPAGLLVVFDESGRRSRSHGLRPEVLQAQADACALPLYQARASWQSYERAFTAALAARRDQGVTDVVFGDIDLEDHRAWEERVCASVGLRARLPLWQRARREILERHWQCGFRSVIVAVDAARLGRDVLGSELTPELVQRFERDGIDGCGENGEFHTVVVAGPMFGRPIELEFGDVVERGGYLAIDAWPR